MDYSQAPHRLHNEVVELIGVGAAAGEADVLATIHGETVGISFNECIVASFLGFLSDFFDRLVPADVLPVIRAGAAHLRFQQSPLVQDVLVQGRPFGTEGSAVDRVVGIAFHVYHLGSDVLGFVTESMDNDAATDGAIGAGRSSLGGSGYLQFACLGLSRSHVETENCGGNSADCRDFQELTPGRTHIASLGKSALETERRYFALR